MRNAIRGTTPWGMRLLVVALGMAALTACERRLDTSKSTAPKHEQVASTTTTTTITTTTTAPAVPSSGNLIGTPPAPPTRPEGAPPETTPVASENVLRETPQTTASSDAQTEISKTDETQRMPLPGQPNDHSNVALDGSQRAGQVDPQQMPERANLAPNRPARDSQAATQ